MAKQPEFKKYLPLEGWFHNQPASAQDIELTFDQVEAILGSPLPKSAGPAGEIYSRLKKMLRTSIISVLHQ